MLAGQVALRHLPGGASPGCPIAPQPQKYAHSTGGGGWRAHSAATQRVQAWKRQTWRRLWRRGPGAEPRRNRYGMALLCLFLVAMELICVFLGNAVSFDTYRQTVQQTDKPDYTLLSNHTGSRRETEAPGSSRKLGHGPRGLDCPG
ncbi:MAG: hypothetical protein ACLU9S_09475 [Oscillospiraceae bacterium]